MVRMGRWNGVLAAALALVLNGWPAALRAQDDSDQAQLKALNQRAIQLYERGEYQKATDLFEQVVELANKTLGPDHPNVANSLNNLAELYKKQGRYAEAEPLYKRSLKIKEAKLGPDHPDVAKSLNNLAELYRSQGRYAEAEPLYKRSLEIWEAKLGPDHPDVAKSLNNLAVLHVAQGQWLDAVEAFDRARRTILRHIVRVLPALAEKEQLTFLKATDESALHRALSLAVFRSDDRATAARSAGWLLNGKGLAQQALADRVLLARDGEDPIAAKLVTQLRDVRNRLAALTLATPRPGQEGDRKRELTRLDEQERELSKKLGQVTGRPKRDDPWVEPDAVRKALPADAVLVEIGRFDVFDFKAKGTEKKWQPAHYAAWVIPAASRGDVQVIDLGEARRIEEAVSAVRRALQPEIKLLRSRGEPDAEQQLQKPLQDLARLVLHPLLPHIARPSAG